MTTIIYRKNGEEEGPYEADNDKYWEVDEKTGDRLPYLDSIHVKKIVDENVRWVALRAGDMDYIHYPSMKVALQEAKTPTPGIVTVIPQPVGNTWIYFNCSRPPFDNKKVRQAVAFALNKEEIVRAAYWGLGEPVNNQPFLKRSRMHIPIKDREVDLDKAKHTIGMNITVVTTARTDDQARFLLQEMGFPFTKSQ